MKTFTIDRSKWRSGGGLGSLNAIGLGGTSLLNPEGFSCCLGLIAKQCGLLDMHILNKGIPSHIEEQKIEETISLKPFVVKQPHGPVNTTFSKEAIRINDDLTLNLPEREKKLKELFLKHDIKLVFINEPVKN